MPPETPSLAPTVQQHIILEQKYFAGSADEFAWLLSGITIATKIIQAKVRRSGLSDSLGEAGSINIHGEAQKKLDVFANEILMHCLKVREAIGVLASEENETPLIVHEGSPRANFAVVFDPLDGSSNIDVGLSVGTIWSIYRKPESASSAPGNWLLQPGRQQVAAGYVLYGSSTVLVYTIGHGVHGFTLDPTIGAYVLSHPFIRIPKQGSWYSVNEGNYSGFPPEYQAYIRSLKDGSLGRRYGLRYTGTLVADFHRTLLTGGVFLYPPTQAAPEGKLRLLYEASPIAMLAEQAGGLAVDGRTRILDKTPSSIHERTPLVVGGEREVTAFLELAGASHTET